MKVSTQVARNKTFLFFNRNFQHLIEKSNFTNLPLGEKFAHRLSPLYILSYFLQMAKNVLNDEHLTSMFGAGELKKILSE